MKKGFLIGTLLFTTLLWAQESVDLGVLTTYIFPIQNNNSVKYDSEDIHNSNASDLPGFLKSKGYLVLNTGGMGSTSSVSINGYTSFCIKVYIDGVLANNPNTGEFDWNSIDLNSIQSISVNYLPVPGQTEFAGASLWINTKFSSSERFQLDYEQKSYQNSFSDTNILHFTYNNYFANWVYKLDFSDQRADNFYDTRELKTNKNNQDKLCTGSIDLYTIKNNLIIDGFLSYASNDYSVTAEDSNASLGVESDQYFRGYLRLHDLNWEFKIGYQFTKLDYNETHKKTHSVCFDGTYKTDFGLNFSNNTKIDFDNKSDLFQTNLSCNYPWKINDKFRILLSMGNLVWSVNNKFNYQFIPTIRLDTNFGLSYGVYRSFVLPTFNQLYWEGAGYTGNPNLKPETGFGQTLCYEPSYLPVYGIITNSIYQDKIRWTGNNGQASCPENIGTGYYICFTLGSKYEWDHFGFNCNVSYNHVTLDSFTGNQIMWVPRWQAYLNLNTNWKYVSFSTDLSFCGKRFKTNENFSSYNPYFLLGASITIKPTNRVSFVLKGENLLDERYVYHDNYYAPSRSISFMIKISS